MELPVAIWMRDILHNGLTAESASHHVRFSSIQNDSNAIPIGKGMRPGAWTPHAPRAGVRPTSPRMEIRVGIIRSMGTSFRTGNPTSDSDSACRYAVFGILETWNLKNLRKSFVFTGFAKSENFAKI